MWIFKTDLFKLILALSILGGILGLFWFAQYTADKEAALFDQQRKNNPTAEKIAVDNYELKEVDDANQVKWKLSAKRGEFEKDKRILLQEILMQYFDGDKVKMRVVAPTGIANESTRQVELNASPTQKVIAEGEEGKSRMETAKLELTKKNQFTATGGVNIVWSKVAKVTGNYATGAFGKTDLEGIKIVGNTHAIIE